MKRALLLMTLFALICGLCAAPPAYANDDMEAEEDGVYTMRSESGAFVTSRMGRMYVGDECIAADNLLYRVVSVDNDARVAIAQCMGEEPNEAAPAFSALSEEGGTRLICMYSTHSDESYVDGDGDSSLLENAGIYDVGNELKKYLEAQGIEVEYSEETFHPHDAGAYRRSRSVASELLKQNPDALIDIHRDAVPAEQYETEIEGQETSKVRLFVGKSNQNASENRAFAKQLKAVADEEYPGLIKDIYIGKGNYNQDLYPQAILLEFGTHKIDKELALNATEYMANVLTSTLYSGGQSKGAADRESNENTGVRTGVWWLIGLAVAAAVVFALFTTGSFRGAGQKLTRSFREMTGGAFGKRK